MKTLDNGHNLLLYGIYVAVAVISESSIAEFIITLSVAYRVLFKVKAILRDKAALCSDKTLTLMQDKTTVHNFSFLDLALPCHR